MSTEREPRRILVQGDAGRSIRSAISQLVLPALLLRAEQTDWSELVHVYVPTGPVVAFSSRDLRSPGIRRATAVAREAGFEAVVRSPGGRMVAYDEGAVVIDHLTKPYDLRQAGDPIFARHAQSQVEVLRSLGVDARVGEVEGEYCPGEFSVNAGGRVKVIGSAQRITRTGALLSTVVQVDVSDAVHDVIVSVSEALGYALRESTIGGVTDFAPGATVDGVADALVADHRRRRDFADEELLQEVLDRAASAASAPQTDWPFDVDVWTRAHPLNP